MNHKEIFQLIVLVMIVMALFPLFFVQLINALFWGILIGIVVSVIIVLLYLIFDHYNGPG